MKNLIFSALMWLFIILLFFIVGAYEQNHLNALLTYILGIADLALMLASIRLSGNMTRKGSCFYD